MTDTFDFQEALSYIKAGLVVSLKTDIERRYYLNQFGDIVCVPNKEERLLYKVSIFDVEDIMSDNWELCS